MYFDDVVEETLEEQEPAKPKARDWAAESAAISRAQQEGQNGQLRTAAIAASNTTPERAAEVRRLAIATGLSDQTVERRFDELSKKITIDNKPYAQIMRESPALAAWATEPVHAAVAADDMEKLGFLEWLVSAPGKGFAQGQAQQNLASLRSQQLYDGGAISREDLDKVNAEKYAMEFGGRLGAGENWFAGAIPESGRQFAQLVNAAYEVGPKAAIGAGIGAVVGGIVGYFGGAGVGAGPGAVAGARTGATWTGRAAAAKYGFELEAGLAYDEFLDFKDESGRKIGEPEARGAAIAAGVLNAGLEMFGLEKLLTSIPTFKSLGKLARRDAIKVALSNPTTRAAIGEAMKGYAGVLTAEGVTEVGQRLVTILAGDFARLETDPSITRMTPGEIAQDLANEAAGAAQGFLLISGTGPSMQMARDLAKVDRAEKASTFFQALADGVNQSETIKRMPEAAQAFLARATEGGPVEHVYMPVQQFREYFQGLELDPAKVAEELTGRPDALAEALKTGEDLKVSTSVYAVKLAGTEHHVALSQELRLAPDEMNTREATVYQANLEAQLEALEASRSAESPAAAVRKQAEAQLVANGFPVATARKYAALYEQAFGVMAARNNQDPVQLYERYGLKIERPLAGVQAPAAETGAPAAGAQAGATIDPPGEGLEGSETGGLKTAPTGSAPDQGAAGRGPVGEARPFTSKSGDTGTVTYERRADGLLFRTTTYADGTSSREFLVEKEERGGDFDGVKADIWMDPTAPTGNAVPKRVTEEQAASLTADDFANLNKGAAPAVDLKGVSLDELGTLLESANPEEVAAAGREIRRRRDESDARKRAAGLASPGGTGLVEPIVPVDSSTENLDTTTGAQDGAETQTGENVRDRDAEPVETSGRGDTAPGGDQEGSGSGAALSVPRAYREHFLELAAAAPALGYTGSPSSLVARYLVALEGAKGLSLDLNTIGDENSWRGLLVEIAKAGGIGLEAESALKGEIQGYMDALAKSDGIIKKSGATRFKRQGQRMPLNVVGIEGSPRIFVRKGGLSLDGMREHLEQDPRWAHYAESDGLTVFMNDLDIATTNGGRENRGEEVTNDRATFDVLTTLEGAYGVRADQPWWNTIALDMTAENLLEENGITEAEADAAANANDTSFNVEEFGQGFDFGDDVDVLSAAGSKTDTLETGEQQPRLPGDVGDVREAEVATPEMEVPFALQPQEHRERKKKQTELFQSAYHGSPHIFDKFSLQAIGTGEGAQAYGWGLYFAGSRDVAEYYRKALAGNSKITLDGDEIYKSDLEQGVVRGTKPIAAAEQDFILHVHKQGGVQGAINYLTQAIERLEAQRVALDDRITAGDPDSFLDTQRHNALVRRNDARWALEAGYKIGDRLQVEQGGRLYKVEIPEDGDYLHWDRPLHEQSDKVQHALRELGIDFKPFTIPTLKEALRYFNRPVVQRDAAADIGTRASLREGHHYVMSEDVKAFEAWYVKHGWTLVQGTKYDGDFGPRTGEQAYERIHSELYNKRAGGLYAPKWQQGAQWASEELASLGVAGIKYLDGNSRRAGEGNYNYVLFDENLVQITEFYQAEQALTPELLNQFGLELQAKHGGDLVALDLYLTQQGDIKLDTIAVARGANNAGLGTAVLQDLTAFADQHAKRIILSLPEKGFDPVEGGAVTTSKSRVERFYRRFGFVRNTGRHKDFSIRESMYREPTVSIASLEDTRVQSGKPADRLRGLEAATVPGVQDARRLPFASIPEAASLELLNARDRGAAVERRTVRFSDLVATQETFNVDVALEYLETPSTEVPEALEAHGRIYLLGGHHRAVAAWAQGMDSIEVDVQVVNAEKLAGTEFFQLEDVQSSAAFRAWFGNSKVVDKDGKPLQVYHGTRRLDRFGPRVRKSRATSGPMPFFTDDATIASRYADQKQDTSLDEEGGNYEAWFRMKVGRGAAVNLDRAWWQLTPEQRATIAQLAPRVTTDDGTIVLGDESETSGTGGYDQHILEARGNHLKALIEEWLNSGNLFGDEQAFEQVLTLAGVPMDGIEFHHPNKDAAGVVPVYLSIETPLDTFNIPPAVVEALRKKSRRTRAKVNEYGADLWAKDTRDPREWMAALEGDIAEGKNSFAWSSIPDWVTAVLKDFGYDGIQDRGGKQGGQDHTVWIPFEPGQVKSSIGNRGTFNPASDNILHAPNRRGSIRFGSDRQMTITLLEKANLSTFLHETGHFFLEVMQDLEKQGGVDAARDLGVLREWFGSETIGVEQHEQFARGFEAYLMEGKAPSLELREAFAAFRAWLVAIYRTITGLNVQLTPEVRAVMDRMLATDQAIADAAAASRVDPMFLTAEAAGMTEKEFALYRSTVEDASTTARERLERKLLLEVQRETTREWKERRDAIEGEVTADVHSRPIYQVLAAIRRGTTPAGEPLEPGMEVRPFKLSKEIIVARYGADRLKRLPKPYVYATDGEHDPDALAMLFGFSSGDELLLAIENSKPMAQVIQEETNQRMFDEDPSLLLDGAKLEAAAEAALGNEDREVVIRAELRALGALRRKVDPFVKLERAKGKEAVAAEKENTRQADQRTSDLRARARGGAATIRAALPPAAAILDQAKTRIARTKIKDLDPAVFWNASRRAATRALEMAARQDLDGAIVWKQRELLGMALYRQANIALEDVEARVRQAKGLAKVPARQRLGLAGEAYLDQVDGILDRYEFAQVSDKVLARRTSLRKFVESLEAQGLPVDIPEEVLEEARRVNYRELTVEGLVGVSDAIKAIVHLANLKNRLLASKDQRELEEITAALVESIRDNKRGDVRAPARDRRPSEERRRTIGDFFAGHVKLANMLRELDGFKDGGPAWSAIMRPLNDAANVEAQMMADATKAFATIVEKAFPGKLQRQLYDKTFIPAIGISLSRMERIMVAANWGNEGNRERIRLAEGWSDGQVQAILDSLLPAELTFVQDVFDLINGYWGQIEAKQTRVFGIAPEKVAPAEIVAAGGTIRGGYFPLKYDDRMSASAIAALDLEAANLAKQAAYAQSTTKRGHTKERQVRVKMPVRMDFGVMFEHVGQVIHDLSHHETLIDVARVLGHRDVQKAILETAGDQVYKQIRNTIRDVAFGDVPAVSGFERAVNHVRMGATVAGLGWNLVTSLLQPIGLTNSVVRIGPKWVIKGLTRWTRNPTTMVETVRWINDQSPFMAARSRTMQREIQEIRSQLGVETGTLTGWVDAVLEKTTFGVVERQAIADSYFWMIQQAQRLADVPTWLGAYEKAMAGGHPEETAIALADQAVLDSQGGGQIKDLAQVQRGGPMMKLWTNFYSYFNVVYNQAREARRSRNMKKPAEIGRMGADYLMLFVAPATIGFLVKRLLRGGEDDEDLEELAKDLVVENASYVAGTMLGVREFSAAVTGAMGYEGPAGARAFAAVGRLGDQARQGELDAAFIKALNDVGGVFLHYPAGQVKRTVEGIAAIIEGKTVNPLAPLVGPPRGGK